MISKSIETKFGGIIYRSRLEARWAVFFAELRIPFLYEPEGYSFNGVGYLPDFFLTDQDCFIEIKPATPNKEESEKAGNLALFTGKRVFIFFGSPQPPISGETESAFKYERFEINGTRELGWDNYHWWCQCDECKSLDIQFDGRAERIQTHSKTCSGMHGGEGSHGYNSSTPALVLAYEKAASFRFENQR